MKTISSLVALAAFAASALAQEGPRIETPPSVIVCQPTLLTWSGGTPPYFLNILPGGQPSAAPLEQFANLQGTSFTWNTDQPAGTSIGLTIRDSTGATGSSAPFTINDGPDTSCLNASGSSSAGASSTSSSSDSASAGSSTSSSVSAPATTSESSSVTTPVSTSSPLSTPVSTTGSLSSALSSASRIASSVVNSITSSAAPSPTGGADNSGAQSIFASAGFAGVVGAFVAAIVA